MYVYVHIHICMYVHGDNPLFWGYTTYFMQMEHGLRMLEMDLDKDDRGYLNLRQDTRGFFPLKHHL